MGGNRYPVSEHLVREKVQVRFDPFDLTKVRVYHNGLFVEVASPEKLTTHTHHKAAPHRPKRPAALDSACAFRAQMSEAYQNQVAETLVGLPKNMDGSGLLSQADFFELLRSGLSRHELRTHEKNLAFNFYQHTAPVPRVIAEQALSIMVAEKGTRLHLRAYFRKIHEAVAAARGGQ